MTSPEPPHPHILCLLGRAGAGKTTVARYLSSTYGARVVSLAEALKRAAKAVMGFSDEQLYGDQEAKEALDPRYGMSARQFLQRLGTEGLREHFGKDVHVRNLVRRLHDMAVTKNDVFIIDDTRFPDEAEYFGAPSSRLHGAVIKIVCTDSPRWAGDHESERAINEVSEDVIAATVISSRKQGHQHLFSQVEHALDNSLRLARFRGLFRRAQPDPYDFITRAFEAGER